MTQPTDSAWAPCPFCNAILSMPKDVRGSSKAAVFHPGVVTDNDCPLSGRGFFDDERETWNRRAGRSADSAWVLVPREPTFKMLKAGADMCDEHDDAEDLARARGVWTMMLAAAPTLPTRHANHPGWIDGVALKIAQGIAGEQNITDVRQIARIQIGAIEGIKYALAPPKPFPDQGADILDNLGRLASWCRLQNPIATIYLHALEAKDEIEQLRHDLKETNSMVSHWMAEASIPTPAADLSEEEVERVARGIMAQLMTFDGIPQDRLDEFMRDPKASEVRKLARTAIRALRDTDFSGWVYETGRVKHEQGAASQGLPFEDGKIEISTNVPGFKWPTREEKIAGLLDAGLIDQAEADRLRAIGKVPQ